MWEVKIQHDGLSAFRVLKGITQADAQLKADAQMVLWNQRWAEQRRVAAIKAERSTRQQLAIHGHKIAVHFSRDAAMQVAAFDSLLATSLERGVFLSWELLKDKSVFAGPEVRMERAPMPPPQVFRQFYAFRPTVVDRVLPARLKRKMLEASNRFDRDHARWQESRLLEDSPRAPSDLHTSMEQQRRQHAAVQSRQHASVEESRRRFELHDEDAVEYFFAEVLSRSVYPAGFPQEASLRYIAATQTLVVEYELPPLSAWPTHKAVRYMEESNTLREVPVTEAWLHASYESALYQVAFRVISELFRHDPSETLAGVAFNGWVRSVDRSTGNHVHACVESIVVPREAFLAINFSFVEPKACFERLKGVANGKQGSITPVKPYLSGGRDDERFCNAFPASHGLPTFTNISNLN